MSAKLEAVLVDPRSGKAGSIMGKVSLLSGSIGAWMINPTITDIQIRKTATTIHGSKIMRPGAAWAIALQQKASHVI